MKRLKNRIETKKGKSLTGDKKLFSDDQSSVTNTQSFVKNRANASFRSNKSPGTIYSRINHVRTALVSFEKVRKFDTVDSDLNKLYSINQPISRGKLNDAEQNDVIYPEQAIMPSSSIILNNSIEPAYF